MNRNDLDRTIVITVAKKTHGDGSVPRLEPLKSDAAPKSPEEMRKHLAALAALYRMLRG